MLGQAAAVLVALAAFLATNLDAVALLGILDEGLAVAGTPDARFLEIAELLVPGPFIYIVLDRAILDVGDGLVVGQAGWRRGEAANPGLGHGVASSAGGNRHGRGLLAVRDGGRERGDVGARVGDGLASGYAVVGVEGAGEEGMRVGSGVGLAAGQAGGGGARERRTLVRQWPGGLLHFLKVDEESSAQLGLARAGTSQQGVPKTTGHHTFEEAIANDLDCSECETTDAGPSRARGLRQQPSPVREGARDTQAWG